MDPGRVGARSGPAVGLGVLLLGCLLSFYLVGLVIIPVGAWLLKRAPAAHVQVVGTGHPV